MTRMRWALALGALGALAGCGGASPSPPVAAAPVVAVEPAPLAANEPPNDPARAARLAHAAMACFLGAPVEQLVGPADRCGSVLTALGADAASRAAVVGLDPLAVDAIALAVQRAGPAEPTLPEAVRAVAEAAREAARARRAGVDADAYEALAQHAALARLFALDSKSARVPALFLAADRLENARGLAPRAKIAAATPAFSVVLGLSRPTSSAPGVWLSWVSEAAARAGHPVADGGNTHDRAQSAFLGVAWGLAERFEVAGDAAEGELRALAQAYAKRLRAAVADGQAKAKAKADAKATADAAEKKQK